MCVRACVRAICGSVNMSIAIFHLTCFMTIQGTIFVEAMCIL